MKSTNAVSSAFGWDFQSNAAIMLMLKNIELASKVKVEGQAEDVEITFTDGKMLMSQVKAVVKPDDYTNVIKKLQAGLKTLNSAAKLPNVEQLVFVTNSPNPFNDIATMFKFSSPFNIVPFTELPDTCQQTITDICVSENYDFIKEALSVCVLHFHGENEEERYKVLSNSITEFLNQLGIHRISSTELLSLWQRSFAINSTQFSKSITKKHMIWPVIAILCKVNEDDARLNDYDEQDVDEIIRKYRAVINNNSERFEFVSRVISDYNDFEQSMSSGERTKKFVNNCWQNYEDSFELKSANQDTKQVVIRLTIANVLRSRTAITNIKRKVKL
jgi:hypothetical protein